MIWHKVAGSPLILCGREIPVVMAALPAQLPHDAGIINVASRTWPDAGAAFDRHRGLGVEKIRTWVVDRSDGSVLRPARIALTAAVLAHRSTV
jgi:hypothetical protein